ncbi:MAG: hypothetical protein P8Z76_19335 [Alphaproteobacteria bacterium]|jgi:hypothetical protein
MADLSELCFERGPDGLEFAQTAERLILRKRTYRSLDWAFIMLCVPVSAMVLGLFGIGLARGTLFRFSWWIEPLIYGATVAWIWFSLTRAFNRRTITVTADRLLARNGPIPSLGGRLDLPLADLQEIETRGTKHMTSDLTTYRWYHVVLRRRSGGREAIFLKLADEKAAKFVKAKIDRFCRREAEAG